MSSFSGALGIGTQVLILFTCLVLPLTLKRILLELLLEHYRGEMSLTLSPLSLTSPCGMDSEDCGGLEGESQAVFTAGHGGSRRHEMVT